MELDTLINNIEIAKQITALIIITFDIIIDRKSISSKNISCINLILYII